MCWPWELHSLSVESVLCVSPVVRLEMLLWPCRKAWLCCPLEQTLALLIPCQNNPHLVLAGSDSVGSLGSTSWNSSKGNCCWNSHITYFIRAFLTRFPRDVLSLVSNEGCWSSGSLASWDFLGAAPLCGAVSSGRELLMHVRLVSEPMLASLKSLTDLRKFIQRAVG